MESSLPPEINGPVLHKIPGQQKPGRDERHTADRRDGAQGPDAGQGKGVEASRENQDPGEEQPADIRCRGFGERAGSGQQSYYQQSDSVNEMIEDCLFPESQGIGVQAVAQPVSAERPEP